MSKLALNAEKTPTYGSFGKEVSITLDHDDPADDRCKGGAAVGGNQAVSFHDIEYCVSSRCFSKWKPVLHGVRDIYSYYWNIEEVLAAH